METKVRLIPVVEIVLGILALLSSVGMVIMAMISMPYILEAQPYVPAPTEAVLSKPAPQAEAEAEETQAPSTEPTIPPELNPYTKIDFQYNQNNYLLCQSQDSYPGIDISSYQGVIDWQQVADSGIRFAIIRLGYRGWGREGRLVEDEMARQNLRGAREAGLQVGAYFFSQALNEQEVDQEIEMMLDILDGFQPDMPLVWDWEMPVPEARTANMDPRTLTDLQLYYCEQVTELGYEPLIYFNWNMSRNLLYLHELEEYPFWLALYQDRMTYPYRVEMWQYTDKGRIPGIQGDVDINVYMP